MDTYLKLQKRHFNEIPKKFKKVFTFDNIVLHKLLEITQYCLLTFYLTLYLSTQINRFMIHDRLVLRSMKTIELVIRVGLYSLLIAILARYIPKTVAIIPFIGHFNPKYKPNLKGEAMYGINISMGLAFYKVIYNFNPLIEELAFRLFPKSQRLTGPATQMCKEKNGSYIQAHPSCDTLKLKQVFHEID